LTTVGATFIRSGCKYKEIKIRETKKTLKK